MQFLDLFAGIGGFTLGLERAGHRTVAFCEINEFCRHILTKHWPNTPCYTDIRNLSAGRLRADGIDVEAICGGFPCQDISFAGLGAGIAAARSGLWSEYARIIGEVRPRIVVVENVAALLVRGLGIVLGDLAALGYDAEWHCIPAAAVGAPHRRDRVWLVGYPIEPGLEGQSRYGEASDQPGWVEPRTDGSIGAAGLFGDLADAEGNTQRTGLRAHQSAREWGRRFSNRSGARRSWLAEPNVGRVAYGVSNRVDRLSALGNAVVPQIPEAIGRLI